MIHHVRVGEKPLVLLVEDEPDVRRIIRLQLTELGYPVIEAANSSEATRMIENVPDIGVLVTDMIMPGGVDGRALAESALTRRPELRVVFVCGYARGEAVNDEGSATAPILAKPFTKEEIAAAIAAA